MIVETLLIAAMTTFHFSIMPRILGPNLFMEDIVLAQKESKIRIRFVFWLLQNSVVCLNDLRRIATADFAGLTECTISLVDSSSTLPHSSCLFSLPFFPWSASFKRAILTKDFFPRNPLTFPPQMTMMKVTGNCSSPPS